MNLPVDPIQLAQVLWPDVYFYDKQCETIYSVWDNDETVVPAGNMLGKDFVSGFIVLAFFLTRQPCRIITTSVKDDHLRVLWGEVGRYINTSKYPLEARQGGPLIVNHHELKRVYQGMVDPISYVRGMVASDGAAMQGHHVANIGDGIPRTMFVGDEASGLPHEYHTMASTWANRLFYFGNPWECNNFFKYAVEGDIKKGTPGGDIPRPNGKGYYRKIIEIGAEDSPNVKYARAQIAMGLEPTDEIILPGVKSWGEYQKNLVMWDEIQKCVSLFGKFYKGADLFMYPPAWLTLATRRGIELRGTHRKAKAIGVDTGEGTAETAFYAVDSLGVVDRVTYKTPDTDVVTGDLLAFMRKHGVDPEMVFFDRGGGGKWAADRLRGMGYNVRTVAFGESVSLPIRRGLYQVSTRKELQEEKYIYKNRRAEMYGTLRLMLDPRDNPKGVFALPSDDSELIRQLSPIPLRYDGEGRLVLPPKNKRDRESDEVTMTDLIGCSPDRADALVLAVWGMLQPATSFVVKAI